MTVLIAGHSGVNRLVRGETVKQALSAANSTVAKGVYDATLLETVDADLVGPNIITGKTIFGKAGSAAAGTATHDIGGEAVAAGTADTGTKSLYYKQVDTTEGVETELASLTQAYAAGSLAEAFGFALITDQRPAIDKLRLYMDGVQVAESAALGFTVFFYFIRVKGYKALSGNKIVKLTHYTYYVGASGFHICGVNMSSGCSYAAGVFAGSVKVV